MMLYRLSFPGSYPNIVPNSTKMMVMANLFYSQKCKYLFGILVQREMFDLCDCSSLVDFINLNDSGKGLNANLKTVIF